MTDAGVRAMSAVPNHELLNRARSLLQEYASRGPWNGRAVAESLRMIVGELDRIARLMARAEALSQAAACGEPSACTMDGVRLDSEERIAP